MSYNRLICTSFILFITFPLSQYLHSQQTVDNCGAMETPEAIADELNRIGIRTVTTSVPFLMISPDARAGGMGDLGVATEGDANAMHWNPAKMMFADKDMSFAVSYTPWLRNLVPDINLAYLGFYKKIQDRATIGASIRYFSLGDITFTDQQGNTIGQYNPNEFSIDVGAALKMSEYWSGAVAFRFIYSNLTLGQNVNNAPTRAGLAGSGDVAFFYENRDKKLFKKPVIWRWGINISNIGSKIKYSETQPNGDFIPINLRTGASSTLDIDKYNRVTLAFEFSKLLVPSPPLYAKDENGNLLRDDNGQPIICRGQDPNRSVLEGMVTSFWDAPRGFAEEMAEINFAIGFEYWYNQIFGARTGFFYEPQSKGNRQYFTVGASVRYKIFGLDFSYLVPTVARNPLENTLRFTLSFNFDKFNKKEKTSKKGTATE